MHHCPLYFKLKGKLFQFIGQALVKVKIKTEVEKVEALKTLKKPPHPRCHPEQCQAEFISGLFQDRNNCTSVYFHGQYKKSVNVFINNGQIHNSWNFKLQLYQLFLAKLQQSP